MTKLDKLKEKINLYKKHVQIRLEKSNDDYDGGIITGLEMAEQYIFELEVDKSNIE